jgi:ATP-dependent exoDNAse (exonuclease V) alpha subunit
MTIYNALEGTNSSVFITGKAGTGKSILLRYFATHTKKVVIKVAPTGIAALNIRGQTIHSLFRLSVGFIDPRTIKVSRETREVLQYVEVIIIDEVSMVRADTIDAIDQILRITKKNQLPFGGIQVIAFGDVYQLPPVVDSPQLQHYFLAKYGGAYFFNAHVWKKTCLITYELHTVFRQSNEEFKVILGTIRDGSYGQHVLARLATRVVRSTDIPTNIITLTSTNKAARLINETHLAHLHGKLRTYTATITGNMPHNSMPTDEKLTLRINSQVIFVKNDPDGRWVNGTTGTIKSLKEDYIQVACNETVYEVVPHMWEQSNYVYDEALDAMRQEITGTFTQFPLKLAWAVTIHKSQGCTYSEVAIDLRHGAFAHGQTYVALSRCRTLEGIYLLGEIRPEDIIIDPEVTKFMQQVQ